MTTTGFSIRAVLLGLAALILSLTGQLRSAFILLGGMGATRLLYQARAGRDVSSEAADPSLAVETRSPPGSSSGTPARHQTKQSEDLQPGIKGAFKAFLSKVQKDNIGMLAAFLSWTLLTSLVPIVVGLVAISSLFLRSPQTQQAIVSHLSGAMQGALSTATIRSMVRSSTQHAGLLGIIGFVGVLWGGSNVGGSISTAFQAVFEVQGRSFIKEKLLDIGMIFVFTALMLVIIAGTSAGALLDSLFAGLGIPKPVQYVIGIAISFIAAFLLFTAIYLVFPNVKGRFKIANVWRGAVLAAVLFQILSSVWPIYAHFAHFTRYGAVLVPILVLTAWIYFFSIITMIGGEVVAVGAIRQAKKQKQEVGPKPEDTVPQHEVLRDQPSISRH